MQNRNNIDELLAESFMKIAAEIPIEKITIKEITDKAGVIRPTFYNHFQDKYELIEWIVQNRIFGSVRVLLENGMIREAIILIFRNLMNDKAFFVNAARLEGQNSFESIAENCISATFLDIFFEKGKGHSANNPWITPERMSGYYAHAMTYILMSWIKSGMTVPAEEIAEVYQYIETKSLLDMIKEMEGISLK